MSREANKVIESLQKELIEAAALHDKMMLLVDGDRRQSSFENMLVEQFVLSIAVKWEAFINSLIIAYIIDDQRKFVSNLKRKVKTSNIDRFKKPLADFIKFSPPRELNPSQILKLADPEGENITAKSSDSLENKVKNILAVKHAKKFILDNKDRAFLDFLKSLRNFLSHNSRKSKRLLKESMEKLRDADNNSPLVSLPLNQVNIYLKYEVSPGIRRTRIIVDNLKRISNSFR